MKWIKHDTDANQDNKLQNVLLDYGLEGYGLYWYCLELIGSKVDKDKLTFELEHDARVIARNTGSTAQRVEEMMRYFVSQGLFESVDNTITCLAMAKRLDKSMTSNPEMRKLISVLNKNSTVKEGYVYAIIGVRAGANPEIKIGRSANPHARLKEHEKKYSEFGYTLEMIGTIKSDDCVELETEIHRKLKDHMVRQEWFTLCEEVENILRHDYGLTTTCKIRLDEIRLDEKREEPKDLVGKKPTSTRRKKPEAFKEFYKLYPKDRAGGSDQTVWEKWKKMRLTDEDAKHALDWVTKANQVPGWNESQYVPGITKFVSEKRWLTPLPRAEHFSDVRTAPSGMHNGFENRDYGQTTENVDWLND